jgi:hypothetical protein
MGILTRVLKLEKFINHGARDSMIMMHTGNSHGSDSTRVRRFATTVENFGDAIELSDTSGSGSVFTIRKSGMYFISYSEQEQSAHVMTGISLNSTELTTSISSITAASRLAVGDTVVDNSGESLSWTGRLEKGDIIRAHTDGNPQSTGPRVHFTLANIGTKSLVEKI